jgi:hemoglobin
MRTIENREDVAFLVHSFYTAVRKDELIGHIFNNIIGSEENWNDHFEKLTDFWVTNLLNQQAYKGSPMVVHQEVDAKVDHALDQIHFDQWLALWTQTLNENFIGEKADKAKHNAVNIATFMLLKVKMARKPH